MVTPILQSAVSAWVTLYTWVNNHLVAIVVEWDVESYPDPNIVAGKGHLHELHFGYINTWSAVNKTTLTYSTINEQNLDILAVTSTYVKSDHPVTIRNDSFPDGYTILHLNRVLDAKIKDSGIVLIWRQSLRGRPITRLVGKFTHSRRSRWLLEQVASTTSLSIGYSGRPNSSMSSEVFSTR